MNSHHGLLATGEEKKKETSAEGPQNRDPLLGKESFREGRGSR